MTEAKSKMRSRERQQLRAETRKAVAGLRTDYVLEAIAATYGIVNGRLEAKFRDGFLVDSESTHAYSRADLEDQPVDWGR